MPIAFGQAEGSYTLAISDPDDEATVARVELSADDAARFARRLRQVADATDGRSRLLMPDLRLAAKTVPAPTAADDAADPPQLVRLTVDEQEYPVDRRTAREIADSFAGTTTSADATGDQVPAGGQHDG